MNVKTLFPFLLALALLATVISIDRLSFSRMKDYIAAVDHTRELLTRLEGLSNHLKSAQIYSPAAARVAPPNYYRLYREEMSQVNAELILLQSLVQEDTVQRKRVDQITELIDKHWGVLLENNIVEIIKSGQGWRLNDLFTIHRLINQAIAYENTLLKDRQYDLTQSTAQTNLFSTIFSVLALSILIATFLANRSLNKQRRLLEGFLESIMNTTRNGIVNLQPIKEDSRVIDFKIAYANTAVNELLHLNSTSLVGERLSALPGLSALSNLTDRLVNIIHSGKSEPFEFRYETGASPVWLYIVLSRLEKGLTVTFQDITPLKKYQHELQTKIDQLDRSNKNLQQFAYIASHDLQEPLRKVQQFGDLLQVHHGAQLGDGLQYLQRMQMAASRMSSLIKDLLSFSRISTLQNNTLSVDLTNIVNQVLIDLELTIAETGARIYVPSLPTIIGDPSQLGQLFQNLLSNALKFHKPGVSPIVHITSQLITPNSLPASAKPSQLATAYHRIDISDNGIGFDEKYLARIFQIFQRLHSKNEFAGTGIGLAICEKVVLNHGGVITASSQPNQGATFTIYLPA